MANVRLIIVESQGLKALNIPAVCFAKIVLSIPQNPPARHLFVGAQLQNCRRTCGVALRIEASAETLPGLRE